MDGDILLYGAPISLIKTRDVVYLLRSRNQVIV